MSVKQRISYYPLDRMDDDMRREISAVREMIYSE